MRNPVPARPAPLPASSVSTAPSPIHRDSGRTHPCRAEAPDPSCSRSRPAPPSSSPQTPGTDCNSDPVAGTPLAAPPEPPSTSGSDMPLTGSAANTPDSQEPQTPAPAACMNSLSAQSKPPELAHVSPVHRYTTAQFATDPHIHPQQTVAARPSTEIDVYAFRCRCRHKSALA